jgi:cytochrome P450
MSELSHREFMGADTLQCPFPFYAAARAEAPVYRLPNSPVPDTDVYLVTRYDLIQAVLRDWRTYSNRFGALMGRGAARDPEVEAILAEGYPPVETMLTQDPPIQRAYRGLATKAFGLARMDGYITQICDELIDGFIERGRCDFFAEFAIPLPVFVIADQLGVPRSDIDRFKRWSDDAIATIGRMKGREAVLRGARSQVEMQQYFAAAIEARRQTPRDDVISDLANASFQGERPLTTPEILSILQQLLVAGNETTTNALAGGMVYIIDEPGAVERIAADPSLIPNAVEEILRLEAPTKHMWRVVTTYTELGGTALPAGAALLLSYDAGNRDEAVFADGDKCQFDRANAIEHLSFGGGIHACLGALLSRKEMKIAYERLFARLTNIRLAPDREPPRYFESILHRGFESLHLQFDQRR